MIEHSFKFQIFEFKLPFDDEFYNFVKNHPLEDYEYNSNSYFNSEENKQSLIDKVKPYIDPIAKQLNVTFSQAWIQKYKKDHFHDLHTHGTGELMSFVWYIDCTKNSAKTVFHNPGYPYIDTHCLMVYPEKGKLIVFDGSIPHFVLPNRDDKRLIISGNLKKWLK